ncbi:MAG: AmmeMemoRadiSam system radical SAM enzyme [Methanomassiliicoccales archaeon]|nr:MAG: AmmeMemoRadiSam system radical SAM enzyme [Methanomassiliicoccales archaeon]
MKEARFWALDNGKIQCELCARHCIITEGKTGVCGVRKNNKNKLFTMNYSMAAPINVDPIGKKPLFHFYPESFVLSLGTAGCNFKCDYCQNCDLSQSRIEDAPARKVTLKKIHSLAKKGKCRGIAWTYNEPTIWYEFVFDAARFLRKKGFFNVFVTNGYMEKEPFVELSSFIDAINVDIKAFNDEFYAKISRAHLKPVLATCRLAKELGVHIEISYLLVPPLNSHPLEIQKLSRWIKNTLGRETPLHFLRFFPAHRLTDVPATPREALVEAQQIAKMEGLINVYINNLSGSKYQDTYCPECKEMLVHREDFYTILNRVTDGKCPKCKAEVLMVASKK